MQLQYDGIARAVRGHHSFIGAARDLRWNGRDTIGREQVLRLGLGEQRSSLRPRIGDQRRYRGARGVENFGNIHFECVGGFIERLEIRAVTPHQLKNTGCGIGIGVRGNPRLFEDRFSRRHV